jgi:hypothetical protein
MAAHTSLHGLFEVAGASELCCGGISRSPELSELKWPVPMRINATTAAPMIVAITQGVRDFLVVGVGEIGLSGMVRLLFLRLKNFRSFRRVPWVPSGLRA